MKAVHSHIHLFAFEAVIVPHDNCSTQPSAEKARAADPCPLTASYIDPRLRSGTPPYDTTVTLTLNYVDLLSDDVFDDLNDNTLNDIETDKSSKRRQPQPEIADLPSDDVFDDLDDNTLNDMEYDRSIK